MQRSVFAFLLAASASATTPALAQSKAGFSTLRFHPAPGPGNYLEVEGTTFGPHLTPSASLVFDYATDTLVAEKPCSAIPNVDPSCANRETTLIEQTGLLHLTASLSLMERIQLGLDLPLGFTDAALFSTHRTTASDGASPAVTIAPADGFALADARLSIKGLLLGEPGEALRVVASAFSTVPSSAITDDASCASPESCSYLGERGAEVGGRASGEFVLSDLRVATSVGAAYRPHRHLLDAETGSEVSFAVAGRYALTPLLAALAEVSVAAGVVGQDDVPFEGRGAIQIGRDLQLTAGAGAGMTGPVGVPSFRAMLGLSWVGIHRDADGDGIEDGDDACPAAAEDRDRFMDGDGCPELDNDADGIADAKDRCADRAEDMDGYKDDDGCPEEDNDEDGVPDGFDSCEGQREDRDGDHDDDGCPDLDDDRDGVVDADDKCPQTPEDTDNLMDQDGCPEDDADGDGMLDADDGCPDRAEWWNGIVDQDGCPDDDEDRDSVPDAVDRCPAQAETLNGREDGDGCPDGDMAIVLNGQRLLFTLPPDLSPGSAELWNATIPVEAVAAYVRRNHRRGTIRVVMVSSANDTLAAPRAEALAALLRKRLPTDSVTSGTLVGEPSRFEIELLPPGWSELPRPKSAGHAAP